jgi:hypothetical protein
MQLILIAVILEEFEVEQEKCSKNANSFIEG